MISQLSVSLKESKDEISKTNYEMVKLKSASNEKDGWMKLALER